MVEISEIYSASSQTNILQDPTFICVQIYLFILKIGTWTKNGNFGAFLVET